VVKRRPRSRRERTQCLSIHVHARRSC
jgi:hypothetical protein